MRNYAEEFRPDLAEFRETTTKFYNGEVTVPVYKGFSGGFGSYAQRGAKEGMLRLRMNGGRLTKERLAFLAECVKEEQIDMIHLTTCESIQLHNLSGEQINKMIEPCWDHGFITRGGGGDFPRNVMMSPLAGVDARESFDVTPYVEAAGQYLLGMIKEVHLPRKLKVCFSNSVQNYPHATFRDLGFVANAEGKFDVYSAGGLGRAPRFGVKVAENVEPNKILYYVRAMIDTFMAYGDYENRGKARSRFMQEKLGGPEAYKAAFLEKLALVEANGGLDIDPKKKVCTKTGEGVIGHTRAIAQKQEGLYAVEYHPLGGNLSPKMLQELAAAVAVMDAVELRVTPDEGLYIINCTAKEAEQLIALTAEDAAKTDFEHSVSCVGATICQVGARDSHGMLEACLKAVAKENFKPHTLPAIRVSGCPSSCAAHQTNVIGFRGGVKQTADGPRSAFELYVGGCDVQGSEQMGTERGAIIEEEIPQYLIELGRAVEAADMEFMTWFHERREEFEAITAKYVNA